MNKQYRIGIDIGGTFTDFVVFDRKVGDIVQYLKTETTPTSPDTAVINGAQQLIKKGFKKIEMVIHATTIATNALLGQIGLELPKIALVTTKGFKDVIEIGRQRRSELYNLFVQRPKVLVPRKYRFEVDERINYRGEIINPLSNGSIAKIITELLNNDIETVAISLLHSYANPIHEIKIKEKIEKNCPGIYISVSSEVSPEHREYERTSTTVVNAVLMPIVSKYLNDLSKSVQSVLNAPMKIMQSNGGMASIEEVVKLPVSIIESGPASGVLATILLGNSIGRANLMSFDMGGTTAKAGTILKGIPLITTEYEVGGNIHAGRIIKGSGYPVRYPFIDLSEISAGGGSIIWVDEGGALRVGPISAGAEPGPASYGKGGKNPTITDANLILGRLNQKYLLGGDMRIYLNLAQEAFKKKISDVIGLDEIESAIGALKIANNIMSKIMRIVSIERGIDPRDLSLVAFGGAGPMHACALAEELDMKEIIIPTTPGLFSAVGLLATDFKHVFLKSVRRVVDEIDPSEIESYFCELENKGYKTLMKEGIKKENIVFHRYADMRYWGQGYELIIPSGSFTDKTTLDILKEKFAEAHKSRYGYIMFEEDVELVNIRVEAIGIVEKPEFRRRKRKNENKLDDAIKEERDVYFEEYNDFVKTIVYSREKLPFKERISGPAIIEQYDSTTVVYPMWSAEIDQFGNIVLRRM